MPPLFVLFHAAASGLCLRAMCRLTGRWRQAFAALILLLASIGFVVERRSDWAGIMLRVTGSNLVFLTNGTLEAVIVLLCLLWQAAVELKAKRRAVFLSVPLLCVALWSYTWYFAPLPQPLTSTLDRTGYCPQSTPDSCSAASAVMLLHLHGISATEAEMAYLCLTRANMGTPTLGLVYGLEQKVAKRGLHPRIISLASPAELGSIRPGCILSVGLKRGLPADVEARMRGYGWEPGVHHAVVIVGADPNGAWLDVADPGYGREHWPLQDFAYIWDGQAIILTP